MSLSEVSDQLNFSLIVIRSYGMIGYIRLYQKEHTVIQSKPADKVLDDLRLAAPFKELEDYVLDFDFEGISDMEHGHTPYVVILVKALHLWKESHEGELPKTFQEKDELKTQIRGMARNFSKQINFSEAIDNAFKAFSYEAVPSNIQEILNHEKANSTEFNSNFW